MRAVADACAQAQQFYAPGQPGLHHDKPTNFGVRMLLHVAILALPRLYASRVSVYDDHRGLDIW